MNNSCINCPDKVEDKYGLFCDLVCGKYTAYINYQAGIKEVVEWCNNNFEPTIPMTLDYRKWQSKLKEWEC